MEIDEFKRAYDTFLTPCDIKDTMVNYLPLFLTRLHAVKRLCKVEKYEEKVMRAMRSLTIAVLQPRINEVLLLLKAIMLVRHVDRSIREKSIRAMKMLLKLCPTINEQL